MAKGLGKGAYSLGSYVRWAEVLGGILDCGGVVGFLENRVEAASRNADQRWALLIAKWVERFSTRRVTGREVMDLINDSRTLKDEFPEFTEGHAARKLGKELPKHHGRVYGGYQVNSGGENRKGIREFFLKPTQE